MILSMDYNTTPLSERKVFEESFRLRKNAFWAGGGLGALIGGIIGAGALLSTLAVGVSLVSVGALALPVIGAYAVFGSTMGATALTSVGPSAGAVWAQHKHAHAVQSAAPESSHPLFSWRNAAIFGALGVAAAVTSLAVAAAMPGMGGLAVVAGVSHFLGLHMAASMVAPAMACMTVATLGLFGAWFGFDGPTITADAMAFVENVFSGKSAVSESLSTDPARESASSADMYASPHDDTVSQSSYYANKVQDGRHRVGGVSRY